MRRRLRTPLALAVLNLLHERSMHPYEMQQHMRERAHDQVVKLKGGSLYSTIERLTEAGLTKVVETSREGRRPERTVYAITETGREELLVWLHELLAEPIHEYPWFGSALAFLAAVSPDDALTLLDERAANLESEIESSNDVLQSMFQSGLPRLFGIEGEYALAMRRAELAWVRQTIHDIRSGQLTWPPEVLAFQQAKESEKEP